MNASTLDATEDLLSEIWRAGRVWNKATGYPGEGLYLRGCSSAYVAEWTRRGTVFGNGACIADALFELLKRLGREIAEFAKEDDSLLESALQISLTVARLEGKTK